jgi:hypothetical protein
LNLSARPDSDGAASLPVIGTREPKNFYHSGPLAFHHLVIASARSASEAIQNRTDKLPKRQHRDFAFSVIARLDRAIHALKSMG